MVASRISVAVGRTGEQVSAAHELPAMYPRASEWLYVYMTIIDSCVDDRSGCCFTVLGEKNHGALWQKTLAGQVSLHCTPHWSPT